MITTKYHLPHGAGYRTDPIRTNLLHTPQHENVNLIKIHYKEDEDMKKLLALLCALVMILGVAAGCTGPANGNDPSAGNNGGSTGPDGRTRSAGQIQRRSRHPCANHVP